MKRITIKQGDQFSIPIHITVNDSVLSADHADAVEFMLGNLRKMWYASEDLTGDVTYEDGTFFFPLTQEETLAMPAGITLPLDVRILFAGGSAFGPPRPAALISVADAISQEVL